MSAGAVWRLTARALGLSVARQVAAGGITAFIPVLLGGLVGTRFDLVLAALIAWILWAVVTDRMTAAWVLLALAVLVKLIPLAFIPVLVMVHVRRHGGSDALKSALTGLAVLVVVALPLALIAPSGLWDSVSYHLDRPLQLESTGAAYLMAMRLLAGIPLAVDPSFGSPGLQRRGPDPSGPLLPSARGGRGGVGDESKGARVWGSPGSHAGEGDASTAGHPAGH